MALALSCCLLLAAQGCTKVTARRLAKEGNDLYRSGRYKQALERFEAAAKLDPDFPTIHLHMGYSAMSLAATSPKPTATSFASKAIAAFRRFKRLAPGDERGPKFYLQALLDAGRTGEALGFLEQQHIANPKDVTIVSSLGAVSSRAGQFENALKWYEKRASLLPGEPKPWYLVGTLCWEHLYKNSAVVGAERVRVADRGIQALQKTVSMRADSANEALVYINLLFRERAKGQDDPVMRDHDMRQAHQYHEQAVKALKATATGKSHAASK